MRFLPLVALLSLTVTSTLQGAPSVTFTDTTFNLANYSESPVFTTGTATVAFSQCSTCGNPGQALQINIILPGLEDLGEIGFANNTFLYNPSTQGAITTIDASVDKDILSNIPIDPTTPLSNTFRPLIEQDGIFYLAMIAGPSFNGGNTGFNTISQTGLGSADFVSFNFADGTSGTAHPNFAGDPILLGLAQFAQFPDANVNFTAIYDNLHLTLNTVPVAAPEPSASLLVIGSLVGLAWFKRRGGRSAAKTS